MKSKQPAGSADYALFTTLTVFGLLPLLTWPFFLDAAIYEFRRFENGEANTYLLLVVLVPAAMIVNAIISYRMLPKRRNPALLLTILPILFNLWLVYWFLDNLV